MSDFAGRPSPTFTSSTVTFIVSSKRPWAFSKSIETIAATKRISAMHAQRRRSSDGPQPSLSNEFATAAHDLVPHAWY
ncbi:hypothetical protein [Mycobacteroides abscessus]|uniref:hypothetical protein n=1 Tax=Mycobacteroides abscessus TaxID=36809 RepID=UPI0013FCF4A4|nr:hypothetical protein [Mycobacteroides abscessus]